jgi:hypothetical protein
MSTARYPVRVDATLEPQLSRWLWMVKWLLAIPHYIVLMVLWSAFLVLSLFALVAIVVTGRYPRAVFAFNVGVLRWSWRVAYYAYGGLGTDQYPPFTLGDVPDYPAHLEVAYPEHLSRGLALVKWWLFAIPHYLVLAVFLGGGWYVASGSVQEPGPGVASGGLLGLLVLFAAVALLFTGRYPRSIFDLVLGMNRWVLRVAAYVALMTDEYPPFRLDLGGTDPGGALLAVPPGAPPTPHHLAPAAPTPPVTGRPSPSTRWGAGRVATVVIAALTFLVAGGLLTAAGAVVVADAGMRDSQGFLMSESTAVTSPGAAVVSPDLLVDRGAPSALVPRRVLGDAKARVTSAPGRSVFVGLARSGDVAAYLSGVGHSTLLDPSASTPNGVPTYRYRDGGPAPGKPGLEGPWVTWSSGTGTQVITWPVEAGSWTLVVMNADGSSRVAADVAVGATVPAARWLAAALGVSGGLLMALAAGLFAVGLRRRAAPA